MTSAMNRSIVLAVCSFIVAIGAMFLFRWLQPGEEFRTDGYTLLWEKTVLSAVGLFSLAFGFIEPRSPWRWPLLMMYVHYFSGFAIMERWGQVPPFELIYMAILSLPSIALGYLGAFLAKKLGNPLASHKGV
jgi:hypothetical protein